MADDAITVESIRAILAEDLEKERLALVPGYTGEPYAANEDWFPIRRMTDREIQNAIDHGFSWPARMLDPVPDNEILDFVEMSDDEAQAHVMASFNQPA